MSTEAICQALMKGRAPEVKTLVQQALDAGTKPAAILYEGLLQGMGIIGDKFKKNEFYVPEVLIAEDVKGLEKAAEVIGKG